MIEYQRLPYTLAKDHLLRRSRLNSAQQFAHTDGMDVGCGSDSMYNFWDILVISKPFFFKQKSPIFEINHFATVYVVISIPADKVVKYPKRHLPHYCTIPLIYENIRFLLKKVSFLLARFAHCNYFEIVPHMLCSAPSNVLAHYATDCK